MSLIEKLDEQMKSAMRAKDAATLSTLRLIKTDLKKDELDSAKDLTPEREQAVLKRMAKQRRESIDLYRQGGRTELAEKEATELRVIETFLPASLEPEELDRIIDATLAEAGPGAKGGAVIGKVMAALKATGKAFDGKDASERVRRRLDAQQ
jgi:uncharacterized protein YqeY